MTLHAETVHAETIAIEVDVRRGAPFKAARHHLIEAFERLYVTALLRRHGWDVALASRSSRLSRERLHQLIGKHGLCPRCDGSERGCR